MSSPPKEGAASNTNKDKEAPELKAGHPPAG